MADQLVAEEAPFLEEAEIGEKAEIFVDLEMGEFTAVTLI
jgi:hypothetical protein